MQEKESPMTHSSAVTQILRMNRYVTSTFALLAHAREDFGSPDGAAKLARLLDISPAQAAGMIAGKPSAGLHSLAFYYGFMPEGEERDTWRALPMREQPFNDGPAMVWGSAMAEYVHDVLTAKCDLRPTPWPIRYC
ncbi:hypothetical protein [Devosia sediminis]|uniref:Uncharacterized protein n=2 Tax=Devosia TaxID=46913 RepID=A0A934MNP0_9HYPH|nr:hypothetical protein [Devosia sediminis]MBJ3786991.1 hypothetical protein [Devosia sediminis]